MKVSVEADLLKTLPCVGKILSMVLMLEIGRVDRFPTFQRWQGTDDHRERNGSEWTRGQIVRVSEKR